MWMRNRVMEVEQFYFKFSNYELSVPYNAASNAVYGETGIFPRLAMVL